MSNWSASNYRQRKAQRLALVKPQWVVNPDTSESFYLREVGSLMSSVLSGYLPGGLTKIAVEAWKEKGVEGLTANDAAEFAATLTPEQLADGDREMATSAQIIQQACVIPFLSKIDPSKIEFPQEWQDEAIAGLKERNKDFDPATFDPKELVLHPKDLDNKDSSFLFRWAQGIGGAVSLKGGNVITTGSFSRLPRRLNRGSRTKPNKSQVQQTA